MVYDHPDLDEWDLEEDSLEELEPSRWRRWLIAAVAVVVLVAMALVPLYNVIRQGRAPVANNGLEVCGFDYCAIQDAMRAAGLDAVMSRLSTTYLSDEEAGELSETLVGYLGIDPVSLTVVNRLNGRIEGQYDPASRSILIERPATAWLVVHEVAHAVSSGHGQDFQNTLIDLTKWLEANRSR